MNIKQKYNRLLAKWRLIHRYEYLIEVDKWMSEFVTKTILGGGSDEFIGKQRNQLMELERDISAKTRLIEFLKNNK